MNLLHIEFVLKKVIGGALLPVSLSIEGFFLATIFLSSPARRKIGRAIIALSFLFFLAVTNVWVSRHLIMQFEGAFSPLPDYPSASDLPANLKACKFIVVLGSSNGSRVGLAALDELGPDGTARVATVCRLARLLPDTNVIFSGASPEDLLPHSRVMRAAAISLGVKPERISLIEGVRDTEDEARMLHARLGGETFRAFDLCRKQNLNPIPVPSGFLGNSSNAKGCDAWQFNVESLERSTFAFHEYLGLFWTYLRGQR
jgi:uncharacterized SAM-binding protein YcdF (DUF218 family)